MKESEAREKWCPMVRQPIENSDYSGSFNRGSDDDPANIQTESGKCNCIASDCMMWRSYGKTESVSPKDLGGYCGLAGII